MYIAKNNLYNQMKSKHVEVWMVLAQIDMINLYRYNSTYIYGQFHVMGVTINLEITSDHPSTYILNTKIDVSNIIG